MEKEIKVIITEEDIDKNNTAYNENREFYVYEHIRLDNMTCFYVGKGKGNRIYEIDRNNHHNNISNKYGHAAVIIKDNLTEEEAFKLERERIEYYVFTLGYGIDIEGYKNRENNEFLTNMTWGGEGTSGMNAFTNKTEEEMEIIRRKKRVKYANKTPEEIEIIGRKISEKLKGKNKGKNPYANKTPEEIKIIFNKRSNSTKGKNHYLYGKHHSNETKKKMSEKASKKVVICVTTGKIFNSQTDAGNYYNVGNISKCCKGRLKSAGKLQDGTPLKWKYLENYNNDFKGILINPIIE